MDQQVVLILHPSLFKEVVVEITTLATTHSIWLALEFTYNNSSVERIQTLCVKLLHASKGFSSVVGYGHKFKGLCDQFIASG